MAAAFDIQGEGVLQGTGHAQGGTFTGGGTSTFTAASKTASSVNWTLLLLALLGGLLAWTLLLPRNRNSRRRR
jgi:hypothetical protein